MADSAKRSSGIPAAEAAPAPGLVWQNGRRSSNIVDLTIPSPLGGISAQYPWNTPVDETEPITNPLQAVARWLTKLSVPQGGGVSLGIAPLNRGARLAFPGKNEAMPRPPTAPFDEAPNDFIRQFWQARLHQGKGESPVIYRAASERFISDNPGIPLLRSGDTINPIMTIKSEAFPAQQTQQSWNMLVDELARLRAMGLWP